jgi:hypothetical protein
LARRLFELVYGRPTDCEGSSRDDVGAGQTIKKQRKAWEPMVTISAAQIRQVKVNHGGLAAR